ncbi:MAG: efflux RND transporter periplasmic adaptor subunit [Chloroflexota bacterium]|nr:efflux RND transporter periplasmic adaptor subunit [Chloroflexota bacterium]
MKPYRKIFLLTLVFMLAACTLGTESADEAIQASGTIEAVEVTIAAEKGGQIAEVWVNEGDKVQQDDPLFRLEDKILDSQLHQAESALAVAQAHYNLVAAGLTEEQQQASIAAANLEVISAQQALDSLYKNNDLALAQAQKAIADAEKVIDDTQRKLDNYARTAPQADIDQAFANMVLAKDKLDDAIEDFEDKEDKPEDNLQRAAYLSKKAQAQKDYDAAVRLYNNLSGTGDELDIAQAEADLAIAQASLTDAQQDYETLQAGPDPDDVALAEAQIKYAQTQLALAKVESPTKEELAVAQAQVDAASTNLEAVQVLIDKLIVSAPISGTVTTRNVETGEVIQPGLATMTISQMDELTVTVYIPENQYGKINLGDSARLKVDSFPLKNFDAAVTRIADQAEYTPRNVQTQEERQTTVYAVELSVDDPELKLKPGMPTDVVFGE